MSWLDHIITTIFGSRQQIANHALAAMMESDNSRKNKNAKMKACLANISQVNEQLKRVAHETRLEAAHVALKLNEADSLFCTMKSCAPTDERRISANGSGYKGPERRQVVKKTERKRRVKAPLAVTTTA